jgi:hypothetical protein
MAQRRRGKGTAKRFTTEGAEGTGEERGRGVERERGAAMAAPFLFLGCDVNLPARWLRTTGGTSAARGVGVAS